MKKKIHTINILFLGGAKRVSIANEFIEAGLRHNRTINIYSYDLKKTVPISEIGEVIVGLKWNDLNLMNHLVNIIKSKEIDIVIPFVDPAIVITEKLKESINCLFTPTSSVDVCNFCFNKKLLDTKLKQSAISTPSSNNLFPMIAKPIFGSSSIGIKVLKNENDLKVFNKKHKPDEYILQRYIEGLEYSVDAYITQNGKICSIIPRLREAVLGGEITEGKTENNKDIIESASLVIKKLKLKGAITIQYIQEFHSKKIYLIEINPRFGGGVPLSIKAGSDTPYILLSEFLNLDVNPVFWKENTRMIRYFKEFYY